MDINIKNYTSGIASETTIARIEAKLAAIGAAEIAKLYSPDRKVSALVFNIDWNKDGKPCAIKLPARVEDCYQAMLKHHLQHHARMREETKRTLREQATRTAWRLIQEWLDVQVSLIAMKQAEPLEIFMGFVWDGKQTYFEFAREQKFKMLPAPRDAPSTPD
jgi:hypothetical protein